MTLRSATMAGCVLVAAGVSPALGEADRAFRAGPEIHHLFNPVPDALLRPFSTDRPSRSYSASTLDAGRFQIETDLANVLVDRSSRTRTFSVGSPVLRVGLTENAEFQIGTNLFTRVRQGALDDEPGSAVRGIGSTYVATKVNVFGNGGGDTAMAVVVSGRLPSPGRNIGPERIEGSIDIPFSTRFGTDAWQLTVQPHFSLLGNEDNSSYRDHYGVAAQVSYALTETVSVGVEFATYAWRDIEVYNSSSVEVGVSWRFSRNTQLDAAAYFGLDRESPSFNPYIGVSHRF